MRRSSANLLMLLVALIWGTTFVAQQLGCNHVGPLTYTGVRFLLGALFVMPLAVREYRRLQRRGESLATRDWLAWSGLGCLLFLGAILQQVGINGTTVSNAGFLTALYVPLVPFLSWLIHRERPHPAIWPASLGSFLGTFLLAGGTFSAFSSGDFWVLSSTVFWAAHVLWVGRAAAHKGTPVLVAAVQFVVCGVLSTALAFVLEDVALEGMQKAWLAILWGGLLSVGIGFTLQVVAQRHTPAADAAILLSAEILFAAVAGALYLGERLTSIQLAGGALIFACILAVQLAPLFWKARPVAAPAR